MGRYISPLEGAILRRHDCKLPKPCILVQKKVHFVDCNSYLMTLAAFLSWFYDFLVIRHSRFFPSIYLSFFLFPCCPRVHLEPDSLSSSMNQIVCKLTSWLSFPVKSGQLTRPQYADCRLIYIEYSADHVSVMSWGLKIASSLIEVYGNTSICGRAQLQEALDLVYCFQFKTLLRLVAFNDILTLK